MGERSVIPTRQMTDVPGKRVWGRWPQRVQGRALAFPLDYTNGPNDWKSQSLGPLVLYQQERPGRHAQRASHDALDPLGAARPDPLYLCVILNAGWYYPSIVRISREAITSAVQGDSVDFLDEAVHARDLH